MEVVVQEVDNCRQGPKNQEVQSQIIRDDGYTPKWIQPHSQTQPGTNPFKICLSAQGTTQASGLQAKGIDQSRKCCWLLPPTGIVDEKARVRLAPIFQHLHQRPTRKMLGCTLLRHES